MNTDELKLWSFFVRQGMAYLQPTAKTEAGFFVSTEPVVVVSIQDTELFQKALKEIIGKGNPLVATPLRDAPSKSTLLIKANVKTVAQFEKDAQSWQIEAMDGMYTINQMRRNIGRGWENDPEKETSLPLQPSLDEVAKHVVVRVQAAVE